MVEMEVTFTKAPGRRYFMTVVRESGPRLEPRQGPGYHDDLPHDAVHFVVESEAELLGGVFGRLARGESNIFVASDSKLQRRLARREARRPRPRSDREDMARSEALASLCLPLWEFQAGHRTQLPPWVPNGMPNPLPPGLLERILARLDEFARQWSELPVGGSVTLPWSLPARRQFADSARDARSKIRRGSAAADRISKRVRVR
jgi:hypothetical protein